jgi:hypothetical protein
LATEVEKEEGMRVLISVDMEGLAGVVTGTDVSPGEIDYERNRHLMTNEASAAVRGAHGFSADIETTVADAHGPFTNILPDELDERARLVRGRPRQLGMMSELEGADAAIFVGYHGQSGTATSVLSHTINSGCISDVRCNGRSLGEIGLNASLAAHYGVPVRRRHRRQRGAGFGRWSRHGGGKEGPWGPGRGFTPPGRGVPQDRGRGPGGAGPPRRHEIDQLHRAG